MEVRSNSHSWNLNSHDHTNNNDKNDGDDNDDDDDDDADDDEEDESVLVRELQDHVAMHTAILLVFSENGKEGHTRFDSTLLLVRFLAATWSSSPSSARDWVVKGITDCGDYVSPGD